MHCPQCGYETTVTNICRKCMVSMAYTGKVSRINPKTGRRMTRHYKAKNQDELGKLWTGWGVVFKERSK